MSDAVLWGSSGAIAGLRQPRAPKADAAPRGRGCGRSRRAEPKAASFGIVDSRLGLRHSEATAPESLARFSLDGSEASARCSREMCFPSSCPGGAGKCVFEQRRRRARARRRSPSPRRSWRRTRREAAQGPIHQLGLGSHDTGRSRRRSSNRSQRPWQKQNWRAQGGEFANEWCAFYVAAAVYIMHREQACATNCFLTFLSHSFLSSCGTCPVRSSSKPSCASFSPYVVCSSCYASPGYMFPSGGLYVAGTEACADYRPHIGRHRK